MQLLSLADAKCKTGDLQLSVANFGFAFLIFLDRLNKKQFTPFKTFHFLKKKTVKSDMNHGCA